MKKWITLYGLQIQLSKNKKTDDLMEVYKWCLNELKKNHKVEIHAISGEANPYAWNHLEEIILEYLSAGGKQKHILGPIIPTLKNEHSLVNAYKKSKNLNLYLSTTRYPEHWILAKSSNKSDTFLFHGESYHQPLENKNKRYKFTVSLTSNSDPLYHSKAHLFSSKIHEFGLMHDLCITHLKNRDEINNYLIDYSLLYNKIKTIQARDINFDVLTYNEILKIV